MRQKIDQLRADADLDSLTGLANRRRFRVALAREVERWRRYRVPCALLMLDIDHLKRINDKFGHPAGDVVIRQIAQTLKEVSRDNDTAARLGGEEFRLLLAGVDLEKAAAAANRLRTVLSGKRVEGVGTVTVSIGVAGCPGERDARNEHCTPRAIARFTFRRTPAAIACRLRRRCRRNFPAFEIANPLNDLANCTT